MLQAEDESSQMREDSRMSDLARGMSLTQLTDISLEQAVFRLKEIERENFSLRDKLREQNAGMKLQYENLATFRKKQVEKFEQTKALITALSTENKALHRKLMASEEKWSVLNPGEEEDESKHTMAVGGSEADLINFPENIGVSPPPSVLRDEQPKTQMNNNNTLKLQLMTEVKLLQAQLSKKSQEVEEAKKEGRAMADRLSMEYEQKLMEMARQNSGHGHRHPVQASDTEDLAMLQAHNLALLKELEDSKCKLAVTFEAVNKKDSRIVELEAFNNSLWQQAGELQRAQGDTNIIRMHYQQLQMSYKNLEERLRSSQTLEEINRLTAQVIAADEALEQRDETIQNLKRQNTSGVEKAEEDVLLFKYQAEMYKKDFEEERESRARLIDEKNMLEEEMKTLREQNRVLAEQMEGYNRQQIADMQYRQWTGGMPIPSPPGSANRLSYGDGPGRTRALPPWAHGQMPPGTANYNMTHRAVTPPAVQQPVEDNEEPQSFHQLDCPTCNAQFPDIDSLTLHVAECIDRHG